MQIKKKNAKNLYCNTNDKKMEPYFQLLFCSPHYVIQKSVVEYVITQEKKIDPKWGNNILPNITNFIYLKDLIENICTNKKADFYKGVGSALAKFTR